MSEKLIVSLLTAGVMLPFFQADYLKESITRGKSVYEANCIACHMADGRGLEGTFPPLANTGRLTDKGRLVKIIINGLNDPVTIDGTVYTMEMNPLDLSDKEVADVLNYIRNSWGNKAAVIKENEISQLKK